jgi:hypothetical protein
MEDKTEYILTELDEVKDIMIDNIKQMSSNVVQLEELNEKAENIQELSETLGKRSRIIRMNECWRIHREKFIAFGIIVAVLTFLIIIMSISIMNQLKQDS